MILRQRFTISDVQVGQFYNLMILSPPKYDFNYQENSYDDEILEDDDSKLTH